LPAHGRWFSQGTPASSTTKTGRPDIAEKLLKVALSTEKKCFQNRRLLEIDQPETKIGYGGNVY
jgi:hypothetical protein